LPPAAPLDSRKSRGCAKSPPRGRHAAGIRIAFPKRGGGCHQSNPRGPRRDHPASPKRPRPPRRGWGGVPGLYCRCAGTSHKYFMPGTRQSNPRVPQRAPAAALGRRKSPRAREDLSERETAVFPATREDLSERETDGIPPHTSFFCAVKALVDVSAEIVHRVGLLHEEEIAVGGEILVQHRPVVPAG